MALKDYFNGILLQVKFLTRIPVPVKTDYDERAFAAGAVFAPLIGLLIGLISIGAFLLFARLDARPLAVLMAMVAGIAVTGGIHLDGLADTFDGLFSYRTRERVLAIMKDSRLGTGGAIGLIVVIMLKYAMLVSLQDGHLLVCLAVMPVLSRMTIAWSAGLSVYARQGEKGLAAGLVEHTGVLEIGIATILGALISALFLKLAALPLMLIVIAFTLLMNLYARSRIGGITGDVIGAVIEMSELVFLLSVLVLDRVYAWQHVTFL